MHPYATVLRQRAAHLSDLASRLERLQVTALDGATAEAGWSPSRAKLCDDVLTRNIHQLHVAADDLRERAFRFRLRADELDAAREAIT